jgi:SAM-dependent MidA family methyltransferase
MTKPWPLHDDEREQQSAMAALLEARIAAAGGLLSFADYVDIALYAPALGYYTAGARKFGPGGDFTTAPEYSALFGACIAGQCEPVLRGVPQAAILELGAGSGRLACDVLTRLAVADALPLRYRILELSAELRERQRSAVAALPGHIAARVEWLDRLPDAPWNGVLLANEVLDALPFERVRFDPDGGITEQGVGWGEAGPLWRERPAPALLAAEARRVAAGLPGWPDAGYTSELCLRAGPWIGAVTAQLARGVALFVDYGLPRAQYYHPERDGGTLRCHYRQHAHDDPFYRPGLQDITAWVDFTRVAEAGDAAGLDVLGFATQAAFLLGNGIESFVATSPDDLTRARRASEARMLLMPDRMGEAFKVMALGRGWEEPLAGFAIQDLRGSL